MKPTEAILTLAAELWDELADFEHGRGEAARDHLMRRLCAHLDASNAGWVGAVRTAIDRDDPLLGWRIGAISYLHEVPVNEDIVEEMKHRWKRREVDPSNLAGLEGVGTFRALTFRRCCEPSWFDSDYFRLFYESRNIYDALCVYAPVTEDAESFFIFHRRKAAGPFGSSDIALAWYALRGIKWLHRAWMLDRGLLVASKPLSPGERRVLGLLLSDALEKEIAVQLELSPATVHDYVKSIYQKFGIGSRAGLMSLWLNRPPPETEGEPSLADAAAGATSVVVRLPRATDD